MTDKTMTLEEVRDSLLRIGVHPNSLFGKWERAIEAAIAERKVADGWKCVAPPCKCDDRTARVCAYATFPAAPEVTP